MKNKLLKNSAVLLIAIASYLTPINKGYSQTDGAVAGDDRDMYKINWDNSNHFGRFMLQTHNTHAYTFTNNKDHLVLSFTDGIGRFTNMGTDIFSFSKEGYLGIGITAPENSLHVKGYGRFEAESSADNYLQLGHIGTNSFINFNGLGDLQFRHNGDFVNDLMVLTQDGNLGIGANKPTEKLEVVGNILISGNVTSKGNITAENAVIVGGSQLSSSTINEETTLSISGDISTSNIEATQVTSTQINVGQSQLSSTTENESTLLTVTGGVKTDKVVLNIGSFPDYVFENDYALMPITEVAKYITKNKHLPNIPAEKEMIASGMDMQMISLKLVEKIEELTLYTIQQEEKIKEQQKVNSMQQQINDKLLKRIEFIEKLTNTN